MTQNNANRNRENLGPAERIINTLLAHSDHMTHGRPGMVVPAPGTPLGVKWEPVVYTVNEDGSKRVFMRSRRRRQYVGVMNGDNVIRDNDRQVGVYQPPGLFANAAVWFYRQIAEVWKLDNEFAARWASYAFTQEHNDLKVALAAFMLVQSRKGDPVKEGDEVLFWDENYRDVGEAMMLRRQQGRDLNVKQLLLIRELLVCPEVAQINRDLGFGRSARCPYLGRWPRVAAKWLRYREQNPKMLEGLVRVGLRNRVRALAQHIGYKPESEAFYDILGWKQKQADDGRRTIAIGKKVKKSESWKGLSERQICNRIVKDKPSWKVIVGKLPADVGVTRAIMACAIENDCLSDKEMIIVTPTLEQLGLLDVQDVRERWDAARQNAEDMRARNIARNVRSAKLREELKATADKAAQKAVEEVMRGLRVYVFVDVSGSMQQSIEEAKRLTATLVQSIPLDKLHVATFDTQGSEVKIKHASTKGVAAAFRGKRAGGGTDHGAGIRALQRYQPQADEDVIMIWVGDEQDYPFADAVRASNLAPLAFGFLHVHGCMGDSHSAVRTTARELGIPCFMIRPSTFDDPYAVPRTLRNLIAATPVSTAAYNPQVRRRRSLVDTILDTELLQKPAWA